MFLSDIRYLVGLHLGEKGLAPKIIAPVINILNELDKELSITGWTLSPELNKEIDRLHNAIVLMNYKPEPLSIEDTDLEEEIETILSPRTIEIIEDNDDNL